MKRILLTILTLIFGVSMFAQDDIPERPNPPTLVTDYANMFSRSEQAQLERKLVDFFAATSNQIAVVTVNNLAGYDKADYATRLAHKWQIGKDEYDNGILVLIKPKTRESDGQVQIAVGYGLEAVVPDATAKQIVESEMIPRFKRGDIYGGVDQATTVLMDLAKGEYNYQQYAKYARRSGGGFNPFVLIVLIFFVFPILFGRRRRRSYYGAGGRGSSLPFWLAMGMMSGGRRHSGFYNDFSSGSGSFGGGGSSFGSFGGFGGGGFGGGGAGGSW